MIHLTTDAMHAMVLNQAKFEAHLLAVLVKIQSLPIQDKDPCTQKDMTAALEKIQLIKDGCVPSLSANWYGRTLGAIWEVHYYSPKIKVLHYNSYG